MPAAHQQQRLHRLHRHLLCSAHAADAAAAAGKYPPPPGEAPVPAIWGHSPGRIQQQRAGLSPAEDGRAQQVELELSAAEPAGGPPPSPMEEFQFDLNGCASLSLIFSVHKYSIFSERLPPNACLKPHLNAVRLIALAPDVVLKNAISIEEVDDINAALDALPKMKLGDWLGYAHMTAGPGDISLQQVYELGPAFERLIDHPA
eukprot:SAG31_NODE_2227_length_6148_cov_5.268309_4_plen_203_part_00